MNNLFDRDFLNDLLMDAKEVWPENFEDIEKKFNSCCFSISVNVIKHLGIFQKKDDFETIDSIKKKINIFKDAEYVLKQILEILCEEKVLEKKDGGYICIDDMPDVETPAENLVIATRLFPGEWSPFQWLARASDGIVDFITGKLYAEEVMFPWNDFKLVEEVYFTSKIYGFYSRLAGKVIKRILENKFDSKVKMIEIGAGTGNGTINVLKETSDRFEKYIFTDISKALVQRAQKRIKKMNYGFFEYTTLDVTKNLENQGFGNGDADIALAVNVLHATENLQEGLRGAYNLLKKGGYLILSEIAPPPEGLYRYMELTFGLLPSYSVYSDRDIRPDAAIIRPEIWESEFKKAGFSKVETIPGSKLPHIDRGGIVIGMK